MIQVPSNYDLAITTVTSPKTPVFLIEISGYADKLTNRPTGVVGQRPWIESIDNLQVQVSDLDGGADNSEFSFTVSDYRGAITASFPSFTFEGKVVTLKSGFVGMAQADFALLYTGKVASVNNVNGNQSYQFVCEDNHAVLDQSALASTPSGGAVPSTTSNLVKYSYAATGDVTSDNPMTVTGHPLDILVDILERDLGQSSGLVDTSTIFDVRDSVLAGVVFEFRITGSVTAKDFIEQELLKPCGCYLFINNEGKFTVNTFYNTGRQTVVEMTRSLTVGVPEASQADLINSVLFRFDSDDNDKFQAESLQEYSASIGLYGLVGQQTIESKGLKSSFQGYFQAAITSRALFYRYGLKSLKFEEVTFVWKHACKLEPGDIISYTHDSIPNRATGTIGISSKKFEVLDRSYNFQEGQVTVKLLDASYLDKFGRFLIAPAAINDFASESTLNKGKYMFLCNDSDEYTDTTAAHVLG